MKRPYHRALHNPYLLLKKTFARTNFSPILLVNVLSPLKVLTAIRPIWYTEQEQQSIVVAIYTGDACQFSSSILFCNII